MDLELQSVILEKVKSEEVFGIRDAAGRRVQLGEGGEWMNELNHLRTLRGSFSAVSTPIVQLKFTK